MRHAPIVQAVEHEDVRGENAVPEDLAHSGISPQALSVPGWAERDVAAIPVRLESLKNRCACWIHGVAYPPVPARTAAFDQRGVGRGLCV